MPTSLKWLYRLNTGTRSQLETCSDLSQVVLWHVHFDLVFFNLSKAFPEAGTICSHNFTQPGSSLAPRRRSATLTGKGCWGSIQAAASSGSPSCQASVPATLVWFSTSSHHGEEQLSHCAKRLWGHSWGRWQDVATPGELQGEVSISDPVLFPPTPLPSLPKRKIWTLKMPLWNTGSLFSQTPLSPEP